jgi:4-amino-4-deoxy-L-arabinose transferase-like glycosyltransferase
MSPLPTPEREPDGILKWALPAILVLFLCLAMAHLSLAPTGNTGYQNAPDEAAHVTYVRMLSHGTLPSQANSGANPAGYEWHQPPLYYLLDVPFLLAGERAARLLSVVCGLGCILVVYRAARLVFPGEPELAITAAAFAALLPTHIAIASSVNNDSLLELLMSLSLFSLLLAYRHGLTLPRALAIGACIGLALLTKATAVLLIPVTLIALILMLRQGQPTSAIARGAGIIAGMAVVISGWWFLRNLTVYHQLLPLKAFEQAFAGTVSAAGIEQRLGSWQSYYQLLALWTYQSFFAVYTTPGGAGMGVPSFLPDQLYLLAGLLYLLAAVGLVKGHLRRAEYTDFQRSAILLAFLTLGLTLMSFLAFISRYFQAQGRYLYPSMLAISLLFATGWQEIVPARYRQLALSLLVGLLALSGIAWIEFVATHGRP